MIAQRVVLAGVAALLLPGFVDREDKINCIVNGWVEQNIKPCLNPGFLEYWQESRLPYRGMFGGIVETEEYENSGGYINA
ncbi:MAG: hypothetical protein GX444_20690 [Myxococcales bacterium]|nr:hypothetical protein [Myxococcales bacterium]